MGVIAPEGQRGRIYFGCGGAACLGLIFWALVACCLVLIVAGMSTELDSADAELVAAFYTLSQVMAGSLAFCFAMAALLIVLTGFGIYRQTHPFTAGGEPQTLATITLFFFLFVAGMILAAVLPTLALEAPDASAWLKAGGILLGAAYLLYGMLMFWLTLTAYESYRHAEEGGLP